MIASVNLCDTLIPAKAGIQIHPRTSMGFTLDPRLRGDERMGNREWGLILVGIIVPYRHIRQIDFGSDSNRAKAKLVIIRQRLTKFYGHMFLSCYLANFSLGY